MEANLFFWFKKYISVFTDPLTFFFICIMLCLLWRICVKRKNVSRSSVFLLVGLWLVSTPIFSHMIVDQLESQANYVSESVSTPKAIVVFGCGHSENAHLPLSSRYQACSLYRVTHAVHLQQRTGLPVYFSGGPMPSRYYSEAAVNAELAVTLGMPSSAAFTLLGAIDSASEARLVATAFKEETVYVVTSAMHMLRAARYLEREGVHVLGSPTDHRNTLYNVRLLSLAGYVPQSLHLHKTAKAVYEYLALVSQRFIE